MKNKIAKRGKPLDSTQKGPSISIARAARGNARPSLERITEIDRQLQARRYPNCRKLAESLEVSPKTVQRDIEFMRDRLHRPIEFDHFENGYYYTKPVTDLPTINVSEGEIVALLVAQKAMEQYRGTPFEQPLQSAFRKVTSGLRESLTFDWNTLQSAISFKESGGSLIDLGLFETLSQAVMSSNEVILLHAKLRGSSIEERHVRPYHLACIEKQWYLFGFDTDRNDIRTFALVRIEDVRVTDKTFVRPADFSVSNYLDGAFGVFRGQTKYQIRIRFDKFASRLVSERCWHPSQKIEPVDRDGSSEMTLELSGLEEIERWILSWGGHARVMEPKELADRIKAAATTLLHSYGET